MSKFSYRLWFPQLNLHGDCFDKICEKCLDKIEAKLEDGFCLPTTVTVDTRTGLNLKFDFSMYPVDLCEECVQAFRTWFDSLPYVHFNENSVELWRNTKEETT